MSARSKVVLAITAEQARVLVERISLPPMRWTTGHRRSIRALRARGLMYGDSVRGRTLTPAGAHLAQALRALRLHQ